VEHNPINTSNQTKPKQDRHNDHSLGNIEGSSRWLILWAGIVIALPALLIFLYSVSPFQFSIAQFELKKLPSESLEEIINDSTKAELAGNKPVETFLTQDTQHLALNDSQRAKTMIAGGFAFQSSLVPFHMPIFTDSTKHRILLIGDSEAGGLRYPLNDYCLANGHKFVACVEWYSATVFNFAKADTITQIIRKYKPTYIFIVMGLNELFARDLKARSSAAKLLAKKLEGIPYTWIGPANWAEDNGINDVFAKAADPGTFYPTKTLELPRADDGRHPNNKGYRIWMDSLATWITHTAKWRIPMNPPSKRARPLRANIITINAAKYRGY